MNLAKLAQGPATNRVSPDYIFLSTAQAHEVLADFGFTESKYRQGKGSGFQKHLSIFDALLLPLVLFVGFPDLVFPTIFLL